jgi:uncharacterized protein
LSGLPYGVVDVHVHLQPWEQMRPEVRARMESRPGAAELMELMRRPAEVLKVMDRAGIEKIGMVHYVSPLMGFTPAVNEYSLAVSRLAPDRLIPFGSVHPGITAEPGAPGAEVRRLKDLGIQALKIHPPHQLFAANAYLDTLPGLAEVYGEAEKLGMPVMIHTGTSVFPGARNKFADPMATDDVAVDFPDLRLILAHAGRPLYMETCVFLARRHPNVYLDVSSIPPKRLPQYLPRLGDLADKVLWGTDWPDPGTDLARNVEDFLTLDLPDEARRSILRDNAFRVFGWKD